MNTELIERIYKLKKERNAVIAAHNYQPYEIQETADIVGDSFALSKYCAAGSSEAIVICGVRFMAESAKILAPEKTVLLPEKDAGCPMADMVTAKVLKEEKKLYPDAAVVCYINSSAEVKAESDICCTSSNAVKVVRSVKQKRVLFVPDQNLGHYVSTQIPEKEIIFWKGYCPVHHRISLQEAKEARALHPRALMLAHPECRPEVLFLADFIGSTKQIIDYAAQSPASEFIIGTETGVLHMLKKDNPGKRFYPLSDGFVCPDMKKIKLQSVYDSLVEMKHIVELDKDIRVKAKKSLDRMLEIG